MCPVHLLGVATVHPNQKTKKRLLLRRLTPTYLKTRRKRETKLNNDSLEHGKETHESTSTIFYLFFFS
jgi:hypothetical protein